MSCQVAELCVLLRLEVLWVQLWVRVSGWAWASYPPGRLSQKLQLWKFRTRNGNYSAPLLFLCFIQGHFNLLFKLLDLESLLFYWEWSGMVPNKKLYNISEWSKQKVNYSRWYVIYYSTYVIMGQRVLKLYREILWSNPPHGVETLVVVGWLFWDIKAGEMMKLMNLWRLGDDKEVGGLVQNRSMIELKAADSHI